MLRLIIVDDEEKIRNGLAHFFDWHSIGYETVGLFEDGKDAISFLERNRADVVLTDIKMYEVSGIDLAKHISIKCPQTKVVILSGYKEFELAKEALKYGVCDYILKPISLEEIRTVFVRIRAVVEKEKREAVKALPFSYCETAEYSELLSCGRRLVAAVLSGETEEVYAFHGEWFGRIHTAPTELVFFIVTNLFEELYIRFGNMGIRLADNLKKEVVFNSLEKSGTANLFAHTGKLLLEFCRYLSQKKGGPNDSMVVRAKKYIADHLSENFSVEDVADSVFLNGSYFSREFKRITGENVIDFVIKSRMDLAMKLIREGKYSVSEISSKAGYSDSKYFHRCFKKYCGYTVKEYQKLILKNQGGSGHNEA